MDNVVMGRKPVLELLTSRPGTVEHVLLRQGLKGQDIKELIDACKASGVRYRFLPPDALERSAPGCRQGVAAFTAAKEFQDLEQLLDNIRNAPLPVILALDQVQDPGNVGTLARTLLALGGAGLVTTKHHAARLGGQASRASAGALERLPVHMCVNLARTLDQCADAGLEILKAEAGPQGENLFTARFDTPCVLVLGGEEDGVRPNVAKRCARSLYIPMPGGFESLNVAQAGAIVLGQMARYAHLKASGKP
ncbi:Putative TrmH family tRNA/rRNA methyltransferase [Fundidesulfovibrio magnetotacticus]|uniref:TrmH family tRNA/rRNA methyltransferase n=1 Tax=Fundidesulfovibrio magnetotacticus TaxID=2730080 RepID=A0A6V8LPP7_9BACT|nr:RNA methyltransferase [Fundidesulfovibrio magnetotacticus]GFK93704.1 Putative TrmH family tRNA/rRNA methyltransferase [Fundidesulfovibrio magnetotacticus]